MKEDETFEIVWKSIVGIAIGACVVIVSLGIISPFYNVWSEKKFGEAELARADSNRKIAVLEAVAKKESAKSLADAEIIRAHGVAEANKIIGDSLQDNEGYLRYLWIQGLHGEHPTVVYVPTEANLPILESRRLEK